MVCSNLNWVNVNSQPEAEDYRVFFFSLLHELCNAALLECEMKTKNVKVGIRGRFKGEKENSFCQLDSSL